MIIKPRILGFICITAHPEGCRRVVEKQINYVQSKDKFNGPKNVLIIGASTGYGLASRIVATVGGGSRTIGVFLENESDGKRTATPGWYNSAAFEQFARRNNYYATSINGDAFSQKTKELTAEYIRRDFKKVDLIVYSVASPRRKHPMTGKISSSVLKPIGAPFVGKTVDVFRDKLIEINIKPATEEEIDDTVAVMGGEDWEMWLEFLSKEDLLAHGVTTVAYSYIGSELTNPIYKNGTIGKAKDDLIKTAERLNERLKILDGKAIISVNKAIVTQASAAIPVMPLYTALLFKVMKSKGVHEDCIEQIYRLFNHLYNSKTESRSLEKIIRLDDLELNSDIQKEVSALWPLITTENLSTITDIESYRNDFYHLFGFGLEDIDYEQDLNPVVNIPSIAESQTQK